MTLAYNGAAQPQWYYRQQSARRKPQRPPAPASQAAASRAPEPPRDQRRGPDGPPPRNTPQPGGCSSKAAGRKNGILSSIASLLPEELDFGDLFLAAMLLFLYSESHDEDFLVILAVVGLSIFTSGKEDRK